MHRSKLILWAIVALVTLATPTALRAQALSGGDIVFVEDFTAAFNDANQRVANGWFTWSLAHMCRVAGEEATCGVPEYKQASPLNAYPDRARTGNAQQWHTFHQGHFAGIGRQISVPAYGEIEVQAWASAWSSSEDHPHAPSGATRMRIGVDPTGGVDAGSPDVIWGDEVNPPNAAFVQLAPLTVANNESAQVTVYIAADPQYAFKHNDIYVDDVSVIFKRQGAPALPPAPQPVGSSNIVRVAAVSAPDPVLEGLVPVAAPADAGGSTLAGSAAALGGLLAVIAVTVLSQRRESR